MTATPESPPPVDATDPIDAAREAAEVELLRSAIKTVVQMAVTGADLDAPRNYVAITLTGMRTPFDRAEVHLIRPGGSTPHEARGLAVARAVLAEARADAAHQIADVCGGLKVAPVPPDAVDDPVSFVDGQRETKDAMITRLMRELAAEAKERRRQESLASMWKKNADRAMWDNRRSPVPPSTPPVGRAGAASMVSRMPAIESDGAPSTVDALRSARAEVARLRALGVDLADKWQREADDETACRLGTGRRSALLGCARTIRAAIKETP